MRPSLLERRYYIILRLHGRILLNFARLGQVRVTCMTNGLINRKNVDFIIINMWFLNLNPFYVCCRDLCNENSNFKGIVA